MYAADEARGLRAGDECVTGSSRASGFTSLSHPIHPPGTGLGDISGREGFPSSPTSILMKKSFRGAPLLLAALGLLGCGKATPKATSESPKRTTVRASGSSALQPLVNAAKEGFEAAHQDMSVEVSAGGSRKGLVDVASGAVDIGNSDIPAPADLADGLVDHRVAVVPFAVVANKGAFNESVSKIRLDDLARVFRGELTSWSELGGGEQPIVLINRAVGSGTRDVVGRVVLGSDDFKETRTEDNSGALIAKLRQTRGALSYVALSFVDDTLLTLAIETEAGVATPSFEDVRERRYPLFAYGHLYTRGEPTSATRLFLDYVRSKEFQGEVLPKLSGFYPVIDMNQADAR